MSDTLLPSNATPQERAMELATARIAGVPVLVRDVKNPSAAPSSILAWLAWEFGVDDWGANWTDDQKREAIRQSVAVHRVKGTIGAVRSALAALGYSAQVQEWFNQIPAGAPYTYRLLLESTQVGIDQAALAEILDVVATTKNLRSHLDTIVPSATTIAGPVVACAAATGNEITIEYGGASLSPLLLDGSWTLDGLQKLNGVKVTT